MKKKKKRNEKNSQEGTRFRRMRKLFRKSFQSSYFLFPQDENPIYRDVLFAQDMTVQFNGLFSKWKKMIVIILGPVGLLYIIRSIEKRDVVNKQQNITRFTVKINPKNHLLLHLSNEYKKDIFLSCESLYQRMCIISLFQAFGAGIDYSSFLYHNGFSPTVKIPFKVGSIPKDCKPSICTTHVKNWSELETSEFISIYGFDIFTHVDRIPRILHELRGLTGKDLLKLFPPESDPVYEEEEDERSNDFFGNMHGFSSFNLFERLRKWVERLRKSNFDYREFVVFVKVKYYFQSFQGNNEWVNIRNTPSRLQNFSQIVSSLSNEQEMCRYFWKDAHELNNINEETDYEKNQDEDDPHILLANRSRNFGRRKRKNPRESMKRFSENFELVKMYLERGIDIMKKEIVSFRGKLWWDSKNDEEEEKKKSGNVEYKFYQKYILVFFSEQEGTSFALEWKDILDVKKITYSNKRRKEKKNTSSFDQEFFKQYAVYEVHIKNNKSLLNHHKSEKQTIVEYWALEKENQSIIEFENRLKNPIVRHVEKYEEERKEDFELRVILTEISSEGLFQDKQNLNIFRRPIIDQPYFDGYYIRYGDIFVHLILSIKCLNRQKKRNLKDETGWFLDFGKVTSLVFPITYDKSMEYIHDRTEGLVVKHVFKNLSLRELQQKVSRVCAKYNSSVFHPNMKNMNRKHFGQSSSCFSFRNRHDFIVDLMKELNLKNPFLHIKRLFSSDTKKKTSLSSQDKQVIRRACFRKLVYQAIKKDRVRLYFSASKEFFEKFRLSEGNMRNSRGYYGTDYYIYNHSEVDELLFQIHEEIRNGEQLAKKFEEYEIIKLFDRCFWMRLKKYEMENRAGGGNVRANRSEPAKEIGCLLGEPSEDPDD